MPTYKITKHNKMVCVVDVYLAKGEKTFSFFNAPDNHWDNPKCQRDLLKKDLDKALEKNAIIILGGDTFCLMQGAYDPRKSKSDIRPEHNKANYLDAVINDAASWYKPYANNMIIGNGNHETAILKRQETDVIERFSALTGAVAMGYNFFVVFKVWQSGKVFARYTLYNHHGSGGGGAVTRGQIEHSRQMMYIKANAISSGHVHEKNLGEVAFMEVNENGAIYTADVTPILLIRSSTYKQEFGSDGFHNERGRPPKPLGGTFVDLELVRNRNTNDNKPWAELVATPYFTVTKKYSL